MYLNYPSMVLLLHGTTNSAIAEGYKVASRTKIARQTLEISANFSKYSQITRQWKLHIFESESVTQQQARAFS